MSKYVWFDIETTGLNPDVDLILAWGARITDEKLNVLAEKEVVVYRSDAAIGVIGVSDYVKDMHTKNGLWEKVRASPVDAIEAGVLLDNFLTTHLGGEQGILAGSSVHFDRSFVRATWPDVPKHLSHRHLDVSVFKVLAGPWGLPWAEIEAAHTPLADVDASIAHFEAMRMFLRPEMAP